MDLTNLRNINREKADKKEAAKQRHQDVMSLLDLRETIVKSFSTLVDYLEGRTSKTIVVNQLKEIATPDAMRVVEAVNSLHDTLKTHENTDLSEITSVMRQVLEEAQKIPKEKVDITIPEQKDYVAQFKSLTDAVKAVEKVVKAQKLIAEAPIVNVDAPQVNVDAPDLKPLQQGFKDVVKAVQKIVIPEFKTDNAEVEKLLKKSNELLKKILEKPVSSGGGGGQTWVSVNTAGTPVPIELDADGNVKVMPKNGLLPFKWDDLQFSNVDANGNYQTGTVRSGGSTVATLELTYDADSKLTRVRRV